MMRRSFVRALLTTVAAALLLTLMVARITPRLAAAETLQLGTLAPKSSPWGKILVTWAKAVKEKSAGRLELQIFYNGAQGDEGAMVAKMKSAQLHGALVTAVGLSKIYKPILALQMPGLFSSWAKLDAARDALKGDFEKGASDAGFTLVGWCDVGAVRLMSKGILVRVPDDVKGKKPYMWRDDAIQPIFYQLIGGVTPVPLNVPEVLPSLNTGAVNVLLSPALFAEQLQWSSKLDTIGADVAAYSVGALAISSKALDALPADLRQIVIDTGKVATAALTKRIRGEDDDAFGRLKKKMTVITPSSDERAIWAALHKQVRQRLGQGTFSADLVEKLEALGSK